MSASSVDTIEAWTWSCLLLRTGASPAAPSATASGYGLGLTIDLVEEDDARLARLCLLEEETQLTLCLTDPLGKTIGSLAHEERWGLSARDSNRMRLTDLPPLRAAAAGKRTSKERLSRAGRPVEEHTARRRDVESLKHLRVEQRERDHLLELLDVSAKTTDRVERDVRSDAQRIRVGES